MENEKNKLLVITVAIIIVVIGAVFYWYRAGIKSAPPVTENNSPGTSTSGSPTWTSAPANLAVPEKGDQPSGDTAVPTITGPANPKNTATFRNFNINVNGDKFSPSMVIVYVGDTVHMNFTAVDRMYDFTQPDYGFSGNSQISLPKGKTVLVAMSPSATGKFTFYCTTCGGPSKGPVGFLIVEPKK